MYRKTRGPQYRYETFTRRNAMGERIISVRFLAEGGEVLATRSTGCTTQDEASAVIIQLLQELDLGEIEARKHQAAEEKREADDRFFSMTISAFLKWYWSDEGYYIKDRKAAGEALASRYVSDALRYVEQYIAPWPGFEAPLSRITFALVDRFFRAARDFPRVSDPKKTPSRDMLDNMLNSIRAPINWASARGYCKPVDFSGIMLPKSTDRERDIFTDEEVAKILALPTQPLWEDKAHKVHAEVKPRPRLKGGDKHDKAKAAIDIRMKAFVLLGPFCGFRRGEERGLRWKSVHLEEGFIRVENSYVEGDGDKAPKAKSYGDIPLAPELEVVMWELKQFADALGLGEGENYVLFNPHDPETAIAETTLYRGWTRILSMIGISDAERKRRNLVPHGTRHRFATKLLDGGLSPAEAAKLTRHKTLAMLEHYSDHISKETRDKAMKAIRGR